MRPLLQVFARAPVVGECKTRLIPALGPSGAAELHRNLMLRTVKMAADWRDVTPGGAVELWCSPDIRHEAFQQCAHSHGVGLRPQIGGDLGARMWIALSGALVTGHVPVLVGTDCPWLTVPAMQEMHRALGSHDAAYIPAEDGGYVAVGLARAVPELFAGIGWGSAKVMTETRERARRWGASIAETGRLPDVDVPRDLERLRQDPSLAPLLPVGGAP